MKGYQCNFSEFLLTAPLCAIICYFSSLHRQPKHLLAFLMAELGTRYVLLPVKHRVVNHLHVGERNLTTYHQGLA